VSGGRGGPRTKGFGAIATGAPLIPCPRCGGKGKIAPDTVSIGDRFREQRVRLGKTQDQLSPNLQITRPQIANIEADRSRPGVELLVRASKVFGVSVDYLLGLEKP